MFMTTQLLRCAHTLRQHDGDVLDLSWSPEDRWLASCSVDNTVIVWDVTGRYRSVDNTVIVWDVTGTVWCTFVYII